MTDGASTEPTLPGLAPAPVDMRAELEAMVVADLLGPVGGPNEEIPISIDKVVRDRYLLGILSPCNTVAVDPERADDAKVEGDVQPDIPSDDDPMPDQPAAKATMFPSSAGMSFVLEGTATRMRVEAGWGRYAKEVSGADDTHASDGLQPSPGSATANRAGTRVWKRHPMGGAVDIDLVEGQVGPLQITEEQPEVVIRGRVSQRDSYWLVSLFLVNEQEAVDRNSDEQWLFQVGFSVTAPTGDHPKGAPLFVGRSSAIPAERAFADGHDPEGELAQLDMQYRHHVEFVAGHGTGVHAVTAADTTPGGDPTRAVRLETRSVPAYEVPRTEAPNIDEEPELAGAVFDMKALASTPDTDLRAALEPLVDAYEAWLARQEARLGDPDQHLGGHTEAAAVALANARSTAGRLRAGIDVLASDTDAAEAFRFANEAMWQQRIHTIAAANRAAGDDEWDPAKALAEVDVAANRSWRPFQIGFILLNIPALVDPTHPERREDDGLVDLLFFPTGGGKTESYLGLTAFTLAIRRLRGTVSGYEGEGVAVLMRYTLRLLTSQQFQRATALICACEVLRRQRVTADARWGTTPFRIGLWVGSALTPNRGKEAQAVLADNRAGRRARGSQPVQLTSCPWCGRALAAGTDARYDPDLWRTLLFCGDPLGGCEFTEAASDGEGLPVVTVDEELYRLLPSLVISTADKWAQLPLKGPLHMLFGRVTRCCSRHGYRSEDLDVTNDRSEADSHRRTAKLGPAQTTSVNPLRPPDLIIQDELHLISGPLGTLVGLYETAVDELASWEVDGVTVRPKVVASTATVRRAAEQVHALFWRGLAVFPPPVLDVEDSFFARQRPTSQRAGRRYVGVCAPGQRMASVETRVFTTLLAAGQKLYDKYGRDADPWMTMVGYFSALRELGGAKRLIEDDVRSRLRNAERRGLARRTGMIVRELTSRVASGDIGAVLDELAVVHDPDAPDGVPRAIDVLLATNMISVGVDVSRLGLMVSVGQPKATAEYIQATSRVGRSDDGPGLVFTIYNWSRPRDLSHYETFEHYHATFYRHVEALSVTPFAARAVDRGLTAVLVSLLRQQHLALEAWNPNGGAQKVQTTGHPVVTRIVERVAARAEGVSGKAVTAQQVRAGLYARLDDWARLQHQAGSGGATLGYEQKATTVGLLGAPTLGDWPLWAVPNSLRETEPNVNLIIDEKDWTLAGAPGWTLAAGTPSGPPSVTAEDTGPDEEAR